MIKLRSFWVALAMGCALSMGTTSCGDDDDDDDQPKKEQVNKEEAKNDGTVMQEVVKNYTEKGSNLLDQATSMTSDELKQLATTVVDYNKNKDNAEWMESFLNSAAEDAAGKQAAKDLLDQSLAQIENLGVDLNEITSQDLLDVFSEYFEGSDALGEGKDAGIAQGETHKDLFNAVYEDKLAAIPATEDGLLQMMGVFSEMTEAQQRELVSVALAWANKSDDEAWKDGFLEGVGLTNPESKQGLKDKLDLLAQYKDILAAMA